MFGGGVISLSSEIIDVLENNPNIQFNAKSIFNYIYKEKKQSFTPQEIKKIIAKIRTELHRLTEREKINCKTRGFFQAKPLPHIIQKLENPDVKLHGIKIECQIIEHNTKGILPITSEPNIFEDWLEARGFEPISNNRYNIVKWWENRKITFTFHVSGLIEIFISASSNPLGLHDWIRLLNWFNGFFDPIIFDTKDMFVRQIGFARDFRMLRLEGVSSVSLQVMTNIWSQAYQKDELVRFEHHMCFPKLFLNVDDVCRSLLLITTPLSDRNGNGSDSLLEVTWLDIGVEERIIDLCLENDSLKRKIETIEIILSRITERDIVIDKTLKVLVKDFRERKDPSVEEIVRCMYG